MRRVQNEEMPVPHTKVTDVTDTRFSDVYARVRVCAYRNGRTRHIRHFAIFGGHFCDFPFDGICGFLSFGVGQFDAEAVEAFAGVGRMFHDPCLVLQFLAEYFLGADALAGFGGPCRP